MKVWKRFTNLWEYWRIVKDEINALDWTFKNEQPRQGRNKIHSYPAAMHATCVKKVIDIVNPNAVLDPFGGSGTVLVECARRGITCFSNDLNPLAQLISKAKIANYEGFEDSLNNTVATVIELQRKNEFLLREIKEIFPNTLEGQKEREVDDILQSTFCKRNLPFPSFKNVAYWFLPEVILSLQIIKSILPDHPFYKTAFCECVRVVSNRRSGEFKLFRKQVSDILNFSPNVFEKFINILTRNWQLIKDDAILSGDYTVTHDDTRHLNSVPDDYFDCIITSPPYGDSKTTVSYGQFSRLSLQWLDFDPQESNVDSSLLGGNKPVNIPLNGAITDVLNKIDNINAPRAKEVRNFFCDLKKSFSSIASKTKKHGYHFWVTGNRTVKGEVIPLDLFIEDIAKEFGFEHIVTVYRDIPYKAMPSKNSPSNQKGEKLNTMSKESIVVLQKT